MITPHIFYRIFRIKYFLFFCFDIFYSKADNVMYNIIELLCFDTLSTFMSSIFSFACSFYILTLTGSASLFGTYLGAIAMIETLALPLIGTFIDRVAHKRLLMISQSISTGILLLLFAFTENIPMIFMTLIVLVFVDMIVSSIVSSNLQLISGEYLEKLNSYRQIVTSASGILSPILGGLLVAILSIQNIALINSVTDFLYLLLLPLLTFKNAGVVQQQQTFFQNFKAGFKYIARFNNLKAITVTVAFVNFLITAIMIGVPFMILQQLHLTSKHLGLFEIIFSGSVLASGLFFSIYTLKNQYKRYISTSITILAFVLVASGLAPMFQEQLWLSFGIIAFATFVAEFAVNLNNIPLQILLQKEVEERYKTRVFALLGSLSMGLRTAALVFFGFVIPLHTTLAFVISGVVLLWVLLYFRKRYAENTSIFE
ncbi:MFS transporter [Staphylococcus pseudintermedius]|nr:MFS transporter [Staphylococcus pseudintermedius]